MAFKQKGQELSVAAAAGLLASGNLTLATAGSARYLAGLTANPGAADPSSLAEGTGSTLRPAITWGSINTGVAPVEVASNGDIYIGPFNASFTITHVALVTTSGSISSGTVLAVAAITSKSVVNGDRLKFASGSIKIQVS
jgi:hypothetical protein